jgi:hypothetical protein
MVKTYGPFASGAGANFSEAQWQALFGDLLPNGVVLTNFGGTDMMAVFADSTGMQVKVPKGSAILQGFLFTDDVQETLAIATADVTNPRIDRVVIRRDLTAKTIDYAISAGTPAASPAPPAVRRDATVYELSLAQVLVGANVATIAAGNVTDERLNPNVCGMVGPWTRPIVCNHATRPTGALPGTLIYEEDTGLVYILGTDAVTWAQVWAGSMAGATLAGPTITGTVAGGATYTAPTLTNPVLDGVYLRLGTALVYQRISSGVDIGQASTQGGRLRWFKAWGADCVISATGSQGFLGPATSSSTWTIKNGDAQMFIANTDNWWDAV